MDFVSLTYNMPWALWQWKVRCYRNTLWRGRRREPCGRICYLLAKIQVLLFFLGMQLDYISPSPLQLGKVLGLTVECEKMWCVPIWGLAHKTSYICSSVLLPWSSCLGWRSSWWSWKPCVEEVDNHISLCTWIILPWMATWVRHVILLGLSHFCADVYLL